MNKKIVESLNLLLKRQNIDGSWSGPLSSRIRETVLMYFLSKKYNWIDIETTCKSWILSSVNQKSENKSEQILNNALLDIFNMNKVNLNFTELYVPSIYRKTLMIYCLALQNGLIIDVPKKYSNINTIFKTLDEYVLVHSKNIKEWALVELLCSLIIIGNILNKNTSDLINQVKKYIKEDNLFSNPATTAFVCLCLDQKYLDIESVRQFLYRIQQKDGGFSYCEIPLWDTGLSIETLCNYEQKNRNLNVKRNKVNALNYILKNQNKDGGWGFTPFIESEADTSSIILHSLRYIKDNPLVKDSILKSIEYFKNLQFKQSKFQGLWPVWRKIEQPSIEVVAHVLIALKNYKHDIDLSYAYKYLYNSVIDGNWEAEWGRNKPYSINAITQALSDVINIESVFDNFILQSQNKDGGWGASENSSSNVSASANAILYLKNTNKHFKKQKSLDRGIKFLLKNVDENGAHPEVAEVIGPRPFVYSDDCSTHNFILQALIT